jgi:hypothetical protein
MKRNHLTRIKHDQKELHKEREILLRIEHRLLDLQTTRKRGLISAQKLREALAPYSTTKTLETYHHGILKKRHIIEKQLKLVEAEVGLARKKYLFTYDGASKQLVTLVLLILLTLGGLFVIHPLQLFGEQQLTGLQIAGDTIEDMDNSISDLGVMPLLEEAIIDDNKTEENTTDAETINITAVYNDSGPPESIFVVEDTTERREEEKDENVDKEVVGEGRNEEFDSEADTQTTKSEPITEPVDNVVEETTEEISEEIGEDVTKEITITPKTTDTILKALAEKTNTTPYVTIPTFNGTIVTVETGIEATSTYSHDEGTAGSMYFTWYVNQSEVATENFTSIANNTLVNSTLSSSFFIKGDLVNASVYADVGGNQTEILSSVVTILSAAPQHGIPLLNTTLGLNRSWENLTAFNISTSDTDNDPVKNIYTWYRNDSRFTLLVMPFEANNQNEESVTKDYTNADLDGTVVGATWENTGGYDGWGMYSFNGTNEYINTSLALEQDTGATGVTISMWVDPQEVGEEQVVLGTSNGGFDWGLLISDDTWAVKTGISIQNSTHSVSTGTWQHIAATFDPTAGEVRVYKDGSESIISELSTEASTGLVHIGREADGSQYFNGSIDEVIVYNKTLSSDQIQELYANNTHIILHNETSAEDKWNVSITPTDGVTFGETLFSFFVRIYEVFLQLFDESDSEGGSIDRFAQENVSIFANFSLTNGTSITTPGSHCNISYYINDTWQAEQTMVYNPGSGVYEDLELFGKADFYPYNATCISPEYGDSTESNNVTIINSAPTVATLLAPPNGGTTITNRSPAFTWSNSYDADEESTLTYTLQIDDDNDFSSPTVNSIGIAEMLENTTHTISTELLTATPYYWRVRSTDGTNTSSWSTDFNFTIMQVVDCQLSPGTIDFGTLGRNQVEDTADDTPTAIGIENIGNVLLNMTMYADALWQSTDPTVQNLPNEYYQFAIRATEVGSYASALDSAWINMTNISASAHKAINSLKWEDTNDHAKIDVQLRVPDNEPATAKQSTMTITCLPNE